MIGYKGRKERDEKRTGEVMREKVICIIKRRISQERKKVLEPDEMLLH